LDVTSSSSARPKASTDPVDGVGWRKASTKGKVPGGWGALVLGPGRASMLDMHTRL